MRKDKGKGRAIKPPSERSPLLGSPSRTDQFPESGDFQLQSSDRWFPSLKVRSILLTLSLILFSLLLSLVLFILLLAYSFKPSPSELSSLPTTAFRYTPPDSVQVVNISDDGILLNISLRCGVDVDRALGIQGFYGADDKAQGAIDGVRGAGADWWESLRRWSAHRAMTMLPSQSVLIHIPQDITIHPRKHQLSSPLLSLTLPTSLSIPLVTNVQTTKDLDWLQSISFTALAKPLASTGELLAFAQKAWIDGQVRVVVAVKKVKVQLPVQEGRAEPWWGKYAKGEKEDLKLDITMPVPHLPGLPSPGRPFDLASLVTLKSYTFRTADSTSAALGTDNTTIPDSDTSLVVNAIATLPNFLPGFNMTLPFGVPFSISLPGTSGGESMMAEVMTEPMDLGGEGREIEVRLGGRVIADLGDDEDDDEEQKLITNISDEGNSTKSTPLSHFLQNYLKGLENPIIVRGLSAIPSSLSNPSSNTSSPPAWLLRSLPSLSIPLKFPGPSPPPKIIQKVTIERMRITEAGGKMRASGIVVAEVLVPAEMGDVEMEIIGVKPDILVFDGPAPSNSDDSSLSLLSLLTYRIPGEPSQRNDEDTSYPPKAFGHIHPNQFLPSTTLPTISDPSEPEVPGKRLTVRAPLENIPLDILPGRDGVLSDFVGKVVFKGGALAGISGVSAVKVRVKGVGGRVGLDGLPVVGEFWVGRQR